MTHYGVLTEQHLKVSKQMPKKQHPLRSVINTPDGKKYARASKRDRKDIAAYYAYYRNDYEHGPGAARRAHRYGIVTTGADARARLKQLMAISTGPAWNPSR